MNLDQLTNFAEITAAFATVVTLIYLTAEIRRNNKLQYAESRRSVLNIASQLSIAVGQSQEASEVFYRGLLEYDQLNPRGKTQFEFLFSVMSSHADLAFTDWKLGITDTDSFETSARDYFNLLKTQGGTAYWPHRGANHAQEFRSYIEQHVFGENKNHAWAWNRVKASHRSRLPTPKPRRGIACQQLNALGV